ncbi:unnamed protein product [Chironomus riparius]|uniref:Uncharacterized protein n=1 Tax=Chironomus riparius TaxID=315576 RepID=A0A9N9S6U6_9DIPT|nr:unnamed protein product [Chironomus riparius]CAG9811492.1 unnamed protein product [Chironomus riparius]
MKILIALSLAFCAVNGFSFFNAHADPIEIAPFNSCAGIADGTRLRIESNCNAFTLCDSGYGLNLTCRLSEPDFDWCTGKCVNDKSVCTQTSCSTDTTTTTVAGDTTTTTSTTTTASTTTSTTPAAVTTTTTTSKTTTPFNIPTVPTVCSPVCDTSLCVAPGCPEQMVCKIGNVCECDSTIMCPTDLDTCSLPENCGCASNCECSDPDTNLLCTCIEKDTSVCTFDRETQCVEKCGCDYRCDSSVCTESTTNPGSYLCTGCNEEKSCPFKKEECLAKCGCTKNCDCDLTGSTCNCFSTCQCPTTPPPDVCPFVPADCVTKCGCAERCNCNGPFCMCNVDAVCPEI